jgi:hypothetical protein
MTQVFMIRAEIERKRRRKEVEWKNVKKERK